MKSMDTIFQAFIIVFLQLTFMVPELVAPVHVSSPLETFNDGILHNRARRKEKRIMGSVVRSGQPATRALGKLLLTVHIVIILKVRK